MTSNKNTPEVTNKNYSEKIRNKENEKTPYETDIPTKHI